MGLRYEHKFYSTKNHSPSIVGAEFVQQIGERIPELDHSLGRYGDLRPRSTARYRLGNLILLNINNL